MLCDYSEDNIIEMKKIKRFFRYIGLHLFRHPRYFFTYVVQYFNVNYVPEIQYLQTANLVEKLRMGKSLIRIGDGEVYIMNYGGIGYQEYDPELRQLFFNIVSEYDSDSNYVLGLNKIPISKTNSQLKKDNLFHCWLPMKVYWQLYFPKKLNYFDATLFYYNDTFPIYLESYLKTKHLVLVTNLKNIEKFRNNKSVPFHNVSFVVTPDENAFSDYENIKNNIRAEVATYGVGDTIILAACGPTSKPLAYELSKEGVVTIDVGRGIEVAYTDERIDHIIYPVDGGTK